MRKVMLVLLLGMCFTISWVGHALYSGSPSVPITVNDRLVSDAATQKAREAQRAIEEEAMSQKARAASAAQYQAFKDHNEVVRLQAVEDSKAARLEEAEINRAIQADGYALTGSIQKHIDDLHKQADDAHKDIGESKKYVIELEKRHQEAIRQIWLKYGRPYILNADGNELHDSSTRP